MIDNNQKYNTYKQLKVNLKKAISAKFWFEACMIEYAIIEDRVSSILIHTGVCGDSANKKRMSDKLKKIDKQIEKGNNIISKKVDKDITERIRIWSKTRNDIVHRACVSVLDENELQDMVLEGNEIVRLITNNARRVKNYCDKTQ